MKKKLILTAMLAGIAWVNVYSQADVSKVWVADNGDGTYKNPVIHADYSDPDVVRVGDDFWMTASSFNVAPGLPILHSKDLVNWTIVGHALREQYPKAVFDKPQHGGGVWAPSIRFHNGEYYIYYGDPDFGIYMTKTRDPRGEWSKPLLVKEAKGWIDPCPLWDDDGNAYLVHAFAGSRAGVKSILVVNKMNREGTQVLDQGVVVFDGHDADPTVEGPKFYKLNGSYYILAPAGGVATGWQLALRSKNVFGPYEKKVVLAQGKTSVNGPHQGALVDTSSGEPWFIHFQDKGPYGRVVHLQPVVWKNGFPVMGSDADADGTGEPVLTYKKPTVATQLPIQTPQDSDEFTGTELGKQWQWHANAKPAWGFLVPEKGVLRLFSEQPPDGFKNLWDGPNLLLQKLPAEEFIATAKVSIDPRVAGEKFGLLLMGLDYSYIGVSFKDGKLYVALTTARDADQRLPEFENVPYLLGSKDFFLRVKMAKGATASYSFSTDGKTFTNLGVPFKAREGKWIGAKIGFFFMRPTKSNDGGSADIDWIRFEK
jgi:beta-xylosidase